jgi:methylenetetrahydrofolate reductase (NADPH)
MFIKDFFNKGKTVYSFELFPPKDDLPENCLYDTIAILKDLNPDYISITYGTKGINNDGATIRLARIVKEKYGITPLAHLTAIHNTKEDALNFLNELKACGIDNVLALRGDIRPNIPVSKDFKYASDLVRFIKENGNFGISAACYPEGHFESGSVDNDIKNLKIKVEAGAHHLNSQLFFDNEDFYKFSDKILKAGINVPVQAGIMPVVKKRQIERIISLTGVKIPPKFSRLFAKYSDNEKALFDAGIAYATEQIIDLLSFGVKGIHLYIMNNAEVASKITNNIASVLDR